jgi:hypothetical protein
MNNSEKQQETGEITGFTPGAWEYGDENNASCEIQAGEAKIYFDRGDPQMSRHLISREEMLANRRLVISAPTMYAELQALKESNERYRKILEPFAKMYSELTEMRMNQGGIIYGFNKADITVENLQAAFKALNP